MASSSVTEFEYEIQGNIVHMCEEVDWADYRAIIDKGTIQDESIIEFDSIILERYFITPL